MEAENKYSHLVKVMNSGENSTIDLGSGDCAIFLNDYNIKIVDYQNGYLAYYGMKIGNGGFGPSKILALKRLLECFNINCSGIEEMRDSMATSFK